MIDSILILCSRSLIPRNFQPIQIWQIWHVTRRSVSPLEHSLICTVVVYYLKAAVFVCWFFTRMDKVHLPGKGVGSRRVPLLITPDIKGAMECLEMARDMCGIPATNVYFFATPSTAFINGRDGKQCEEWQHRRQAWEGLSHSVSKNEEIYVHSDTGNLNSIDITQSCAKVSTFILITDLS